MIQNFSTIVQQDLIHCYDYCTGRIQPSKEEDKKISLAARRLLATVGMAFGAIITVCAIPLVVVNPVGAVLVAALGISLFALSHDVFVMANNETKNMNLPHQAKAIGKAIWDNVAAHFKGEKNEHDAVILPITEGTFFRPLWDRVFANVEEVQA